ncbi:MAG: DUF421 domain-containing protein [Oscillibacter sp.]|nr:DUF421 domain-containing protein [Oscillibacter sp.]
MTTAFVRTVILYFLIMAGLRLMGKRQIGELEPGELVLTMMISDLATVPMQDFGIPLLAGVIPILTLLSLSLLLSQLSLRSVRIRELLCGTPVVLIDDGVLCQRAMAENRYTLDELLEELRQQGCAGIKDIQYAVLENSGKLSILPYAASRPPSARTLDVEVEEGTLPVVLINDGRVISRNLAAVGRDRAWLLDALRVHGLSGPEEAFLLTVDKRGNVVCVRKEELP